jgi:glutathione-independent formaldehyde dehydrogenase
LGAAVVIIGDVNTIRLAHAKAQGFEIVDLSKDAPLHEQIAALLGEPEVDCADRLRRLRSPRPRP